MIRIGPLELARTDLTHNGALYMRRWVAQIARLGSIRLHYIARPDPARHLHDHPWDFVSFVLRGWYEEVYEGRIHGSRIAEFTRRRRWLNAQRFRATHAHQITAVAPGGCWTLVLAGPLRRVWGFETAAGWIDFRTYLKDHEP